MVKFGWRGDLLRGDLAGVLDHAALGVCLAHVRNLVFVDLDAVAAASPLVKLFYFFTLFGQECVVLFFVVSGLLVGGGLLRRHMEQRLDLIDYAIDRASRLYAVLVPAVLLTLGLLVGGLSSSCHGQTGWADIAGNLFFLQNIAVDPICNNHPLWSLSNEAFYYLLAPAILLAITTRHPGWVLTALGLVAAMVAQATWSNPVQSLAFGAGIRALGLAPWFIQVRLPIVVGLIMLAGALVASRLHLVPNQILAHLLIALSFVVLLSSKAPSSLTQNFTRPIGHRLAGFSYSLYLIHMPIGQAVRAVVGHQYQPAGWWPFATFACAILPVVITAWIFGRVFEDRTSHLRAFMRQLIRRRRDHLLLSE